MLYRVLHIGFFYEKFNSHYTIRVKLQENHKFSSNITKTKILEGQFVLFTLIIMLVIVVA